ncbi:MAG: hypothetical protein WC055_16215 [Melioribacteraceae bacterium]
MDIISKLNLNPTEQQELANILSCKRNELATKLAPFANAALQELVSMILGQKVFNRGSDILEYRLYLLILEAFNGRIPDEQDVCRLFQTTASSSRSLIRAVMSKYQYQLKGAIENTIIALLQAVEVNEGGHSYIISVHNLNLVEELNRELAEIDTNLPPVQKKRNSVATFEIMPSSYTQLCERYEIQPVPLDEGEEQ